MAAGRSRQDQDGKCECSSVSTYSQTNTPRPILQAISLANDFLGFALPKLVLSTLFECAVMWVLLGFCSLRFVSFREPTVQKLSVIY